MLALLLSVIMLVSVFFAFTACDPDGSGDSDGDDRVPEPYEELLVGMPDRTDYASNRIVDFANGSSSVFRSVGGYSNGKEFDTFWLNENVTYRNSKMQLNFAAYNSAYPWSGGEVQSSRSDYSYGYYATSMKPMNKSGIISSFFTYTSRPKWDEIDVEFLGKSMTSVQFNYYTSGVGGHEYHYNLGFDASQSFHVYGFDWSEEKIVWYIDGKPVYAANTDIPTSPTKIMMNLWKPFDQYSGWSGAFDGSTGIPGYAEYEWVIYVPYV